MNDEQLQDESPRSDRRKQQRRERRAQMPAERRATERRKAPRRALEWIDFYVEQHEDTPEPPDSNSSD